MRLVFLSIDSGVSVGVWLVCMVCSVMCFMFLGRLVCEVNMWLVMFFLFSVISLVGLKCRL